MPVNNTHPDYDAALGDWGKAAGEFRAEIRAISIEATERGTKETEEQTESFRMFVDPSRSFSH